MFGNLLICTEKSNNRVLKHHDKTPESVADDVSSIKNWCVKQPHLPETPGDHRIERFLQMCNYSIETTKKIMDNYYTMPRYVPEFYERTPDDPRIQRFMDRAYFVPMPKLTTDLKRLLFLKFKNCSLDNSNSYDLFAHVINILDVKMSEDFCVGEIIIIDGSNLSTEHLTRFSPVAISKLNFYAEKVFETRFAPLYFINASTTLDLAINLLKSVLNSKLIETMKIDKGTSLLNAFPKEILPKDYGGSAPSLGDLNEQWRTQMSLRNDWFEKRKRLQTNENLRAENSSNDLFGTSGNFRKLDLD